MGEIPASDSEGIEDVEMVGGELEVIVVEGSNGADAESEVGDIEITIVEERAEDEERTGVDEITVDLRSALLSTLSTSGVVCPPAFGAVCPWHSNLGCRGPSSRPSGLAMEWMVWFRH